MQLRRWARPALVSTLLICAYALGARGAGAPATKALSYGGTLARGGVPIDATDYSIAVSLWDVETGGSVGTNRKCDTGVVTTTVTHGHFIVDLPDECAVVVAAQPELWVEVVAAGAVLSPRSKVRSVPFAIESNRAALASSVAPNTIAAAQILPAAVGSVALQPAAVNAAALADGVVNTAKLAAGAVTGPKIANGSVGPTHLTGGVPIGVRYSFVCNGAGNPQVLDQCHCDPGEIAIGGSAQSANVLAGDSVSTSYVETPTSWIVGCRTGAGAATRCFTPGVVCLRVAP